MEECHYRVIVVSPEKILSDRRFNNLWESKRFTSQLFNVSFDEGHCISQWGKQFRPEYAELGRLRWLLPSHVCFHVVSATMPELVLEDVKKKLNMQPNQTILIRCSNDRPDIHIMVEKMQYSPNSIDDVERILRLRILNADKPCKLMIFANARNETEEKAEHMRNCLPLDLRDKIMWFHSGMSPEFREEAIENLKNGDIWGFWCTDAAGMVRVNIHKVFQLHAKAGT